MPPTHGYGLSFHVFVSSSSSSTSVFIVDIFHPIKFINRYFIIEGILNGFVLVILFYRMCAICMWKSYVSFIFYTVTELSISFSIFL